MGFTFMKKLPTPAEIRNEYPIDAEIQALKEEKQQAIDKYQEKCAALLEKHQDRKPEEVTTEK